MTITTSILPVPLAGGYGSRQNNFTFWLPIHPAWLRCENSKYTYIPAFPRLAMRAPRHPKLRTYFGASPKNEDRAHFRVYRPWGNYESIDGGHHFQVKRITVNPGEKLSLQMHRHRDEHWIVVKGTALVECNGEEKLLTENQSTYIPIDVTYRLTNPGKVLLELVEVQTGACLDEDNIVRLEGNCGRY